MTKSVILTLLLLVCCWSIEGVDVSELLPSSTFQCFRTSGFPYTIIRASLPNAPFDSNSLLNLNNARAAGLSTQIYTIPCRTTAPSSQVDQLFANLPATLYTNLWVSIQANSSQGCPWATDFQSNCDFLTDYLERVKSHGKNPGIFTSAAHWKAVMGTGKICNQLATQPLWYIQNDNKASFNNFAKFGGWTNPNMKQYRGNATLCGTKVNQNFYHFY